MPIIGEQIREIQEKAEALCRETRGTGTPYEPLGRNINKWTRELSDRGYLWDEKDVPRIKDLLGQLCILLHEDYQDYPCKIVEGIREGRKAEDTLSDITAALSYLVPSIRLQPPIDKTKSDGQPEEHRTDHRKKTAIEIIAAIAVSVLVGIVSSRYLEDLTPTSSTVIAFIAFIILLIIILTQNRDRSS